MVRKMDQFCVEINPLYTVGTHRPMQLHCLISAIRFRISYPQDTGHIMRSFKCILQHTAVNVFKCAIKI